MTIVDFKKAGWRYRSKLITYKNEESWNFDQSIDEEQVFLTLNYCVNNGALEIFVDGYKDSCFPMFNGICKTVEDFMTILRLLDIDNWVKGNNS